MIFTSKVSKFAEEPIHPQLYQRQMCEIFERIAPWNNYSSENKQIAAEIFSFFRKGQPFGPSLHFLGFKMVVFGGVTEKQVVTKLGAGFTYVFFVNFHP